MNPRLTHFAINTDDVAATQTFYGSVFGWRFQDYGPPGFVQIVDEDSGSPMGAIQQRRQLLDDQPTRGFECTFGVDDVEAARLRIIEAGWSDPHGAVHHLEGGTPHRLRRSRGQPRSRHGVRRHCRVKRSRPEAGPDPRRLQRGPISSRDREGAADPFAIRHTGSSGDHG
ncbi:MAG: hypothetical protein R2789_08460 [Microthrixaceae bacterium]